MYHNRVHCTTVPIHSFVEFTGVSMSFDFYEHIKQSTSTPILGSILIFIYKSEKLDNDLMKFNIDAVDHFSSNNLFTAFSANKVIVTSQTLVTFCLFF